MAILKPHERDYVQNVFKLVKKNVMISFFTQDHENQALRETRQILEEMAAISDKIVLNEYDFDKNKVEVNKYGITKIPATVVEGDQDFGIRYFGVPSGYLVSSIIENVIQLSKNDSELSQSTIDKLHKVTEPVNLQVFVTSTSPHSPAVVNISQRLAMEKNQISAHLININDFPHLAMRYNVTDVPLTIVNNEFTIDGAPDENDYIDKILNVLKI